MLWRRLMQILLFLLVSSFVVLLRYGIPAITDPLGYIASFTLEDVSGKGWASGSLLEKERRFRMAQRHQDQEFGHDSAEDVPESFASKEEFVRSFEHEQVDFDFVHLYPSRLIGTGHNMKIELIVFNSRSRRQLLKPDKREMTKNVKPESTRQIPIRDFIAQSSGGKKLKLPTFLFFKVGRCGSTLLDSMLSTDPRYLLVGEPSIFQQVASTIDALDLRAAMFFALVSHFAKPIHPGQQVVLIDFNSRMSYYMKDVITAVPQAHHAFLWRQPIEVADSIYSKPLGWLRVDSGDEAIPRIRTHLEKSVHDLSVEDAIELQKLGLKVFWYPHVVSGRVAQWVVDTSFPQMPQARKVTLIEKMVARSRINSKTGKPWPEDFVDHNEVDAPWILKAPDSGIWYNPTLVQFRIRYPPTALYTSNLPKIKVLRWPDDTNEIEEHLHGTLSGQPVIVRNALKSTGLPEMTPAQAIEFTCPTGGDTVNALHATRIENQFIWHPNRQHNGYDVYAAWERTTCKEWSLNRSQYIISKLPTNLIEQFLRDGSVLRFLDVGVKKDNTLSLRISHEGSMTPLHFDTGHSILMQLAGAKELVLWPESEMENLYFYGPDHFMYRRSLADPEYPDSRILPKFHVDTATVGDVQSGDLAYWPKHWAHYIRTTEGPSVSVGKRYHEPKKEKNVAWATVDTIAKVEASRYAKGKQLDEAGHSVPRRLQEALAVSDDDFDAMHDLGDF